jgi:hypothetical protein
MTLPNQRKADKVEKERERERENERGREASNAKQPSGKMSKQNGANGHAFIWSAVQSEAGRRASVAVTHGTWRIVAVCLYHRLASQILPNDSSFFFGCLFARRHGQTGEGGLSLSLSPLPLSSLSFSLVSVAALMRGRLATLLATWPV